MEITAEVRRRKLKLKQDLEAYSGDDPLQLPFDFLYWLDSTYGKDNCLVDFNEILVDSLNRFWQNSRYYNDERFIRILLYYCDLQDKPLEILERSFKKGIGLRCSGFYSGWANKLCQVGMYNEANRIFSLGFSNKAAPEDSLDTVYKQFLQTIGKKYFQGELNNVCSKCSGQEVKKENGPTLSKKDELDDICWEMNPLKVGETDNFRTEIYIDEEADPTKKPMYPKDNVYRDRNEYCLEELKAVSYLKMLEAERSMMAQNTLSLKLSRDESRREQSTVHYGEYTKEAMDVIQQLWNSPGTTMKGITTDVHKTPFTVHTDNIAPMSIEPRKTTPFTVFTEDEPERNDLLPKSLSSLSKPQPAKTLFKSDIKAQSEKDALPEKVLFSERKPETKISVGKEQPFHQNFTTSNLMEKFSQASIAKKSMPFADEDDTTCNTKAFAFLLPSSTPVHQKKSQPASKHEGSFIEENEKQEAKSGATDNLSVIYEASKERFSSSSSSNGSSARTPGLIRDTMRPLNFETIVEDPFCPEQNEMFLSQINFPLKHHLPFYAQSKSNMPNLTKNVKIDNKMYTVISEIGKGAYARVVRARCGEKDCALKVEKPACKWEFYIAKEIQKRVNPDMAGGFCDIEKAYIFQNGSILQMNWAPYGTLLSLLSDHKIKTGRPLNQQISLYFGMQIIEIIDTLHSIKIIHGDVKPDNFVVTHLNYDPSKLNVQLIDFGRCIDMTFFPEGTQFTHVVNTDGFMCNEMKENKPWTYQADLYGLAGSLYCLLAGNYMKVVQKEGVWKLASILPRTLKRESWDLVFQKLLNVKSESLPNLREINQFLQNELGSNSSNLLSANLRQLQNVFR